MEIDERTAIDYYLKKICKMEFDKKWEMSSWEYEGKTFIAKPPNTLTELLDEAMKYENDLGEYAYDIKKDYIVVFVYEYPNRENPAYYFIINVKNMELEMIQDHDNSILVDEDHIRIAGEYCQAKGIKRSPIGGWLDIPSIQEENEFP